MKRNIRFLAFGVLTFLTAMLHAQLPHSFTYQGMLLDAAKKPVTGIHQILVKLYGDSVNGVLLHSETFSSQVSDGVFNAVVGSTKLLDSNLSFDKQYWLDVSVDGGLELSPRTVLTSVPYAIHSEAASALTNNVIGPVLKLDKSNNLISFGNINPAWSDSLDLGSALMPWKNLYADPIYVSSPLNFWKLDPNLPGGTIHRLSFCHSNTTLSSGPYTAWMSIDPVTGFVGIGVLTPVSALDVLGDIRFSRVLKIPVTTSLGYGTLTQGGNLLLHTYGTDNFFAGNGAGNLTLTGIGNTCVGRFSGASNTTGYSNAFFGEGAGWSNLDGGANSFFGEKSGYVNTSGYYNTFLGYHTGVVNTSGFHNTFVGLSAGEANTSGQYNTIVGSRAGFSNTTEKYNTFIGSFSNGVAGITRSAAIGYNAVVGTSNSMVLGGTGVDGVNVGIGLTAPNSMLEIKGAIATSLVIITTAGTTTTLDNNAEVYYFTATGCTATLPAANSCMNRRYVIVGRGFTVTMSYINFLGAVATIVPGNSSVEIISDGNNWLQIK